ncbi:hypothetical protein KIW84_063837 [Lathyrus oleraceus]|uniref:Glycosyl transferase 48 domain-containing protein n=1 Tax=Pisum sativum TaxID=3888 RepID=A0A9D5A5C0_PEA|nr:hypothetical protein KIW84_063837 [Pisum sativum]
MPRNLLIRWQKVHQQPCHIVYTDYRPTPLQHYISPSESEGLYLVVDEKGKFREDSFHKALNALVPAADGDRKKRKCEVAKRIGRVSSTEDAELQESSSDTLELHFWASYRGQTLVRTVRGMMYYRRALVLQSYLESRSLGVDNYSQNNFITSQGILVSASAGNSVFPRTACNVAPWIFTVAASTLDREFSSNIYLGNSKVLKGFFSLNPMKMEYSHGLIHGSSAAASGVSATNASFCKNNTLDPTLIN